MARKEKAERSRVTKTLSLAILGSILAIVFLYLGLLRGNTPTVEELLEEDSPDSKRYAATDISVSVTPDNRTSTRTPKRPTKAELDQEKVRKEQVQKLKAAAAARDTKRAERTGATQAQRQQFRELLSNMEQADRQALTKIRSQLISLNREADVWQYISSRVMSQPEKTLKELLSIMGEIKPEETRDYAKGMATEKDPALRVHAIEYLAAAQDKPDIKTIGLIARGMIDNSTNVRIATAEALAKFGDRRATAVLINGLDSPNYKVRDASEAALKTIWPDNTAVQNAANLGTLKDALSAQAGLIIDTIKPQSLTTLFDPNSERNTKRTEGT